MPERELLPLLIGPYGALVFALIALWMLWRVWREERDDRKTDAAVLKELTDAVDDLTKAMPTAFDAVKQQVTNLVGEVKALTERVNDIAPRRTRR